MASSTPSTSFAAMIVSRNSRPTNRLGGRLHAGSGSLQQFAIAAHLAAGFEQVFDQHRASVFV